MSDTAVIFYSYTGKTRILAQKKARKRNADLIEVKDAKKRSKAGAYLFGSLAARKQKRARLAAPIPDLAPYHTILILCPLWAGAPAPAFNNILDALPSGKDVEVFITSGSGDSSASKAHTIAEIKAKGCPVSYVDIRASEIG